MLNSLALKRKKYRLIIAILIIPLMLLYGVLFLGCARRLDSGDVRFILNDCGTSYTVSVALQESAPFLACSGWQRRIEPVRVSRNVVVPQTNNGLPITKIQDFSNQSRMQSIVIPSTVTTIRSRAFNNSPNLVTIYGAENVRYIGESAFSFTTNLTNFTLPNYIITIASNAFLDSGITAAHIGRYATTIAGASFRGNTNLSYISVCYYNPYFTSYRGALFNSDKTRLISFAAGSPITRFEIPPTALQLYNATFTRATNLQEVIFPYGITRIPNGILSHASALNYVYIPNSVTAIEEFAFNYATFLNSITIPDSITQVHRAAFRNTGIYNNTPNGNVVYADRWAVGFRGTPSGQFSFREDTVGISYRAIPRKTVNGQLVIPYSVRYIGHMAFEDWGWERTITSVAFMRPYSSGFTQFSWTFIANFSGSSEILAPWQALFIPVYVVDAQTASFLLDNFFFQDTHAQNQRYIRIL